MALVTTNCKYGEKRLMPAPLLSIQQERFVGNTVSPDALIGVNWVVTLNGTIVPTGTGGETFTDSTSGVLSVFREKNEIFKAFGTQKQTFVAEVSGACTGYMISGQPIVRGMSMDDSTDNFTQTATYSIELAFPNTTAGFDDIVSGAYGLESIGTTYSSTYDKLPFAYGGVGQGGVETLTRTVNAKGLTDNALLNAAAYVALNAQGCPGSASGIGFGAYIDHGQVFQREDGSGKDRVPEGFFATGSDIECFLSNRSQDWDEVQGTFSQTDTFTRLSTGIGFNCSGYKVRDEFNWDLSYDWSAGGQNTLTVNGTVQGFASFEPSGLLSGVSTSAIDSAEGYLDISQDVRLDYIKSKASGRAYIHPPISYRLMGENFNINVSEGTISYTYNYLTDAPLNTGVLSETINVTRANPSEVYAEHQVLGRALGPVLQNIGTQTSYTEELSIEAVVSPTSGNSGVALEEDGTYEPFLGSPNYDAIVESHKSSISERFSSNISIFKTSDSESFDVKTGRYTRNIGYIYTECPD